MLLELAVGDAYGAGFEYADELIPHNTLAGYVQHPRHTTQPGQYTDDTQMSIAIAEAMLSGEPWTPHLLAEWFVHAFQRDPRPGYAGGFQAFLAEVRDGADFLNRIRPHSDKSGAAMRACPLGLFPTVAEVVEKCTIQAKLTHDTPDGIAAANAAALMTHYFLYDLGPKAQLGAFLDEQIPGYTWAEPWHGPVRSKGWMSVRAAITAVVQQQSLRQMLLACIHFTGDVDTVAAIALGAAAGSREVVQDLPEPLIASLENGPYGRDYLHQLDEALHKRFWVQR
jgi:ADP-ribosyl-[dinitrogen reductase] hydrolase